MNSIKRALRDRLIKNVNLLSEEEVRRLLNLDDNEFLALLQKLEVPKKPPAPREKTGHEAIEIPFEVGGVEFVAVGFLREGEANCSGQQAADRVYDYNLRLSGRDPRLLEDNYSEIPPELQGYKLLIVLPEIITPFSACVLSFGEGKWSWKLKPLYDQPFDDKCLVVRRRDLNDIENVSA